MMATIVADTLTATTARKEIHLAGVQGAAGGVVGCRISGFSFPASSPFGCR